MLMALAVPLNATAPFDNALKFMFVSSQCFYHGP